ncbi:nucleotide binding protein [[Candida] boidinii]|nr:nucleotide binding protein [[Candida] boidinii]
MLKTSNISSKQPSPVYSAVYKKDLYEFHKTLGAGSFGTVKSGIVKATGQKVAVKIILKTVLRGHNELAEREIKFLATLQHPNIVKLIDWFESKHSYYIVTELALGGELFDRLVQRTFYSEWDAANIIHQLLLAVQYLHNNNVVHRDIKLENILYLTKDENSPIVLADFGVAKQLASKDETLTGVAGSFGYIAPEIYAGEGYGDLYGIGSGGYTKSCDIWSIGVVAYTLIGGQPPIRSESPQDFLQEVKTNNFILFDPQYWQHISPEAKAFILSCMDIDNRRRPTIDQLLESEWMQKFLNIQKEHMKQKEEEITVDSNATNIISNIREGFNATKKFREVVNIIMVQNKLKKLRELRDAEDKLESGSNSSSSNDNDNDNDNDNTGDSEDDFVFHNSSIQLPNLKKLSINSNKSSNDQEISTAKSKSLKSAFHSIVKAAKENQEKILEYQKSEQNLN